MSIVFCFKKKNYILHSPFYFVKNTFRSWYNTGVLDTQPIYPSRCILDQPFTRSRATNPCGYTTKIKRGCTNLCDPLMYVTVRLDHDLEKLLGVIFCRRSERLCSIHYVVTSTHWLIIDGTHLQCCCLGNAITVG